MSTPDAITNWACAAVLAFLLAAAPVWLDGAGPVDAAITPLPDGTAALLEAEARREKCKRDTSARITILNHFSQVKGL